MSREELIEKVATRVPGISQEHAVGAVQVVLESLEPSPTRSVQGDRYPVRGQAGTMGRGATARSNGPNKALLEFLETYRNL